MTLRGWHTTGVYGASAPPPRRRGTLGLDAAGSAHALGLAGSFIGGTWAFMADGAMSKRVHPGSSAEIGLTAARARPPRRHRPARRSSTPPWGGLFETYAPGESDPAVIARRPRRRLPHPEQGRQALSGLLGHQQRGRLHAGSCAEQGLTARRRGAACAS